MLFFTLLPEAVRYGTLGEDSIIPKKISPHWWAFLSLSIQPPPDTVHTGVYLMVSMTFLSFLYSPRRGRPIRSLCESSISFVALHLHIAAVWHGPHHVVLVGLIDPVVFTLLEEAARLRCTQQVFAPSGVGAVRTMRVDLSFFTLYTPPPRSRTTHHWSLPTVREDSQGWGHSRRGEGASYEEEDKCMHVRASTYSGNRAMIGSHGRELRVVFGHMW
jgi:hypothetical protein